MKTIALIAQKGGTGKTTVAVALAVAATAPGYLRLSSTSTHRRARATGATGASGFGRRTASQACPTPRRRGYRRRLIGPGRPGRI